MVDLLIDEGRGADLGDERLNNRLVQIVERFGQSPNLSIPAAKTKAAKGRRKVSRDSRTAEVEIRAARVILNPPWRFDRTLPSLSINVVLVEEQNPPEGAEAVQWVLLTTLPIDTMVAWRVMYLCCLGRECPDLSCEVVLTPSEWKSVYKVKHRREDLPSTPPCLNNMIRLIASLGGYVIRPKTHPGTQTHWTRLQQTHFLAMAWDAFGPES